MTPETKAQIDMLTAQINDPNTDETARRAAVRACVEIVRADRGVKAVVTEAKAKKTTAKKAITGESLLDQFLGPKDEKG